MEWLPSLLVPIVGGVAIGAGVFRLMRIIVKPSEGLAEGVTAVYSAILAVAVVAGCAYLITLTPGTSVTGDDSPKCFGAVLLGAIAAPFAFVFGTGLGQRTRRD